MSAHPPLVPAVRAGRLVKLGAGRLSFFQSLEPADSCPGRPGAAADCGAEPQPHPGRFSAELMHAHGHRRSQTGAT